MARKGDLTGRDDFDARNGAAGQDHRTARIAMLLATCGGIGWAPRMPGTLGALAALPLCWLLAQAPAALASIAALGLCLAAMPIAERARRVLQREDPGCIVIDEMAGMVLALLWLPATPMVMAMGFALFRLLDIVKPWPIGWLDRHVAGGVGIVSDDLAAGAIANLTIRLALAGFGG